MRIVRHSVGFLPPSDDDGDGVLHLGGDGWVDPRLSATRVPGGGWQMRQQERSSVGTWELADDESLCAFLADRVLAHPYPYGWAVDESWLPTVRSGARATADWWSQHGALPYLENHRADGAFRAGSDEQPPEGE